MRYKSSTFSEQMMQSASFAAALLPLLVVSGLLAWLHSAPEPATSLTHYGSEMPTVEPRIIPSLIQSLLMVAVGMGLSIPLGIGTATYIVELSPPTRFVVLLETALFNMAGVPTVLYGLAGILVFGDDILSQAIFWPGAITLGMVALPVIVVSSVQSLRAVPSSLREGALGLGATPWEATRLVMLPIAMPGVITGIVISLARILGEAAALLVLYGAVSTSNDQTRVLPVRIYDWLASGNPALIAKTGTAVAILLACMASINSVASIYRRRFRDIR